MFPSTLSCYSAVKGEKKSVCAGIQVQFLIFFQQLKEWMITACEPIWALTNFKSNNSNNNKNHYTTCQAGKLFKKEKKKKNLHTIIIINPPGGMDAVTEGCHLVPARFARDVENKELGNAEQQTVSTSAHEICCCFFFFSYPFPPQSKARIIHAPLGQLLERIFSSARNPHQRELPELGRLLTGLCKAEDKRVAPPAALLAARGGKEASWWGARQPAGAVVAAFWVTVSCLPPWSLEWGGPEEHGCTVLWILTSCFLSHV